MARGHLAGLLGMESPNVKAVPILYGDRVAGDDLQAAASQLGSYLSTEIMSTPE